MIFILTEVLVHLLVQPPHQFLITVKVIYSAEALELLGAILIYFQVDDHVAAEASLEGWIPILMPEVGAQVLLLDRPVWILKICLGNHDWCMYLHFSLPRRRCNALDYR